MQQRHTDDIAPLSHESDWEHAFSYHPFNIEIARCDGVSITDTNGNTYYDATGGPFTVNLGHGHPRVTEAIRRQLESYTYAHPMLAERRRAELCDLIASVAPKGLTATYLVCGGSEANETAIKIARQYHVATGNPGKNKIISHYESYHGMTMATVALSGNPRHLKGLDPMIPRWPRINQYSDHSRPKDVSRDDWAVKCAQELEHTIHYEGADTVAAFIATPHGSGSDYGTVAPARYWQEVRRICDEANVLFIADEVVTGFGRTGRWFGMEHFGVTADLMTLGKGIASGYMPLSAVTVSDKVNEPFTKGTYFAHGFTFAGHPLACAAAIATIETIRDEKLIEQVREREKQLFAYAEQLQSHACVAAVRGWGLFMVLEVVADKQTGAFYPPEAEGEQKFQQIALKNGLAMYSTLYGPRRVPNLSRGLPTWVSPAFTITERELDDLMDRLDRSLHHWEQAMMADRPGRAAAR